MVGEAITTTLQKSNKYLDIISLSSKDIDLTGISSFKKLSKLILPNSTLIHAAAKMKRFGDDFNLYLDNCRINETVFRSLRSEIKPNIIYISSAAVYGEETNHGLISEATETIPNSFYGLSKLSGEQILNLAFNKGLCGAVSILRPPFIYGKGDQTEYSPVGFLNAIKEGREIVIWGDGSENREFIFAPDLARIVAHLIVEPINSILNVASGKSQTFKDVISTASKVLEIKARVKSKKRTKIKSDQIFNPSYFNRLFKDFVFTPLDKGLVEIRGTVSKRGASK